MLIAYNIIVCYYVITARLCRIFLTSELLSLIFTWDHEYIICNTHICMYVYIYIYIYIIEREIYNIGATQTHPTPTTPCLIDSNWSYQM